MAAGLSPTEFWKQTPRSFVTIMEGTALAAKRRHENELFRAYDAAAFNGAAFAGKLDKCKKFLPKGPVKRAQTPSDMIAAMREFQSRGANMKITHKPN